MNKQIIFGSIFAISVLIFVPFSSVVGYRSSISNTKIKSPLFGIRTNKAVNNKQDTIASDYFGKGNAIDIIFPIRNRNVELFDDFVNLIRIMDDETFDRFLVKVIYQLDKEDNNQEFNKEDILLSLNQIRDNPEVIKPYILNKDETKLWTQIDCPSKGCTIQLEWDCWYFWFVYIILLPFIIPYTIVLILMDFFNITFEYCVK